MSQPSCSHLASDYQLSRRPFDSAESEAMAAPGVLASLSSAYRCYGLAISFWPTYTFPAPALPRVDASCSVLPETVAAADILTKPWCSG